MPRRWRRRHDDSLSSLLHVGNPILMAWNYRWSGGWRLSDADFIYLNSSRGILGRVSDETANPMLPYPRSGSVRRCSEKSALARGLCGGFAINRKEFPSCNQTLISQIWYPAVPLPETSGDVQKSRKIPRKALEKQWFPATSRVIHGYPDERVFRFSVAHPRWHDYPDVVVGRPPSISTHLRVQESRPPPAVPAGPATLASRGSTSRRE